MKSKNRFIKTIIILTSLFLIIFNTFISSFGQELTGEEIISKANESGYSRLILWKLKIEPNVILAHRVSCRKYSVSE